MSDVRIVVDPPMAETDKAWGFRNVHGGLTWVPKSQAALVGEVYGGTKVLVLVVAAWLDVQNDFFDLIGKPLPQN